MKATYLAGCIAILLYFSFFISAGAAATVHGATYQWDTFMPLNNTIVEVNSTTAQSVVTTDGLYSFELPNGTYLLTASYFENNHLAYYDKEVITISGNGSYVVDLLLLPVYPDVSGGDNIASTGIISSGNMFLLSLVAVFLLLVLVLRTFRKKPYAKEAMRTATITNDFVSGADVPGTDIFQDTHKSVSSSDTGINTHESSSPEKKIISTEPLSREHKEILDIIRSNGGAMAQKDLRKYLAYSEAKASMMLLYLEKRGKIQKVREGRGNILFLNEPDN